VDLTHICGKAATALTSDDFARSSDVEQTCDRACPADKLHPPYSLARHKKQALSLHIHVMR